jgi:hypothetical protein
MRDQLRAVEVSILYSYFSHGMLFQHVLIVAYYVQLNICPACTHAHSYVLISVSIKFWQNNSL